MEAHRRAKSGSEWSENSRKGARGWTTDQKAEVGRQGFFFFFSPVPLEAITPTHIHDGQGTQKRS